MAVSKSEHIRQLLGEQPDLTPSEIQAVLADRGVEVTRNTCKVVRHREQQSAAQSKPTTERQLRRGEIRMGTRIVRLSEEDWAIWDFVERHAKKLENPRLELHVMDGRLIRMHRKVRQWLDAVSTRSAKRRRLDVLDHFLELLRERYPKPENKMERQRPVIKKRPLQTDTGPRRLTKKEREARMKKRKATEESE